MALTFAQFILSAVVVVLLAMKRDPWTTIFIYWSVALLKNGVTLYRDFKKKKGDKA